MRRKIFTTLAGALALSTCLTITGCSEFKLNVGDKTEQTKEKDSATEQPKTENTKQSKEQDTPADNKLTNDDIAAVKEKDNSSDNEASVKDADVDKDVIPKGSQKYSVGDITVAYTGKSKVTMVVGDTNETMAVYGDDTTTCGISCYDSKSNEEYANFCKRIIALNHKHKDVNGNIYYTADNDNGKASYIAYEDGTFVLFSYKDTKIFDHIMVYKK